MTIIVTERVANGRRTTFEHELAEVIAALVVMPGNLGVNVIRPEKDTELYHIIYKFDTPEHLEAWRIPETHMHWCERKADLPVVPTSLNILSGPETWFSLPGPVVARPPF